jgi:polyisoprenoid-binding protein YceI
MGLLVFLSLFLTFTCRAQDTYRIDPNQSTISFAVKHMVISTVHGKFTDYDGTILLNENDLTKSSVNITIKTTSLNTEVIPRDNDLRSANFLDVTKYPEIVFTGRHIDKNADGYVLTGDLSMHGVTREVSIPFKYNGKVKDMAGKTRIAVEGRLTIDRRNWGIAYSKVLDSGGLVAGNEVKIDLDVEAVKK